MTQDTFYDECRSSEDGAFKYFYENQWLESSSGKTLKIMNPCTNTPVYEVQGKEIVLV
jgi:hypothetical protein